jgi:osmotically-inducible protein OsmY
MESFMSDRDRQSPYDRNEQSSGNRFGGGSGSSGQAHQWQSDENRQQGGDWQQDRQRGGSDDYTRDRGYSGQGGSQGYGRSDPQSHGQGQGSSGGNYWSSMNDSGSYRQHDDASRSYDRSRGSYGAHNDRNQSYDQQRGGSQGSYGSQSRYGTQGQSEQRGNAGSYAGRDFDASGGNNFANFTGDDFGGRDFYNRGGGAGGGMRSSESYRPSYGLSSWFNSDDDQDRGSSRNSGGEDYVDWRKYGESRGFLQRAGDEVASWFGDEDASRRREQDHRQGSGQGTSQSQSQSHRGRGPSNYTRSDERIREDANDHLTHDHHVDASHINVSVKDGELTLDGTVDSRDAKRRAEDCVEHISGVKHVQNNLRVQDRSSTQGQSGSNWSAAGAGSSRQDINGSQTGSSATTTSGSASGASTTSGTAGSSTTTPGQTGASTTGGIGSSATAGVGSASTTPSSTKTS